MPVERRVSGGEAEIEPARKLCRRCYDAAVRRDRAAAPPLPGVITLAGMERRQTDLGRCSVCNLSGSVYLDRATGTKLCEACYTREAQRQDNRVEGQA